MILRWPRGIFGAALIATGVLFALAFEARYWRWRDCAAISLVAGFCLVAGLRRKPG
ncbi:hypothetical protein [Bradyrhizobium sp. Arg816]|uniref:hypothetical protein n=1 Tax=Bradyrhizobium sp. Arg816 TaxID=2998491 RepID=UPI00249DA16C|nr:hypothetical protein [Bradyrhizobium sp. Arg816]MDI3561008.1 hypothetical protein [Bradyrhizobium sp. Arg816]